jgi:hypothetical protein
MSLEMALSDCPAKKNYVPQFLKQRDINSYCTLLSISLIFLRAKPSVCVEETGGAGGDV